MTSSPTLARALRVGGGAALGVAGVAAVIGVAYLVPERPELAILVAAAVCLFGLTLMDSAIIPLLAVVPALATGLYAVGVKYHVLWGQMFWVGEVAIGVGLIFMLRLLPEKAEGRVVKRGTRDE